ncbi:flavodoxin family protein [Pseudomonadales bacterium]|nr:flavodoxin family protein [Pseudomonadales bacterium]
MSTLKIVGLSASLRGARHGSGLKQLTEQLKRLVSSDELSSFLKDESNSILESYAAAGRLDGEDFSTIYRNLKKNKGFKGLSNSEVGIAAGLWGVLEEGLEIEYCNLSHYFPESGNDRHLEELEEIILSSDGLLLATPVYFGDRSSVAQAFIEFIYRSPRCLEHIKNKVFGGIAVGAKRNGGQETTLIYQLIDFVNLQMLGVGNDSQSTSQYGGTIVAGDVGVAAGDQYGLDTSVDTGRRVAHLTKLLNPQRSIKPRIDIVLVQDRSDEFGLSFLKKLTAEYKGQALFRVYNASREKIHRCIACDICPTDIGGKSEYRCIIKSQKDFFVREHEDLVLPDAILIAAFSPKDKTLIHSTYQKFIERTRYLRRDDYAIGDTLSAPLIISELGSNQNLHLRVITSMIRHHTAVHQPLILYSDRNHFLNLESFATQFKSFITSAGRFAASRSSSAQELERRKEYKPLGYSISSAQKKSTSSDRALIKNKRISVARRTNEDA